MGFTRILESDRVKADRVNKLGDEISAEILKFSTFDLYLKTGNSMNIVKPTGAGTEILTAVGLTETKIYNFNYTLGAETTISKDNRYSFVLPFTRLDTNKTYTFRYVLKVGANTLINVTKNPIAPLVAGYTVEFVSVNQLGVDFVAPVGAIVTLEVWAKSSIADTEIGLLVNDINTMARTSRNEAVAVVSASGINTKARGFSETQEEFNSWEYLTKAPKNNAEFTGTMKLNSVDIGSAIGQITEPRIAKYKSDVAKSIPNVTWTEPSWNLKIYDTDNFVNQTNNNVITINTKGVYLIVANVSFQANEVGYRNVMILKNGQTSAYQTLPPKSAPPITTTRTSTTAIEQCEVGDQFKVQLYQDSGIALNMDTAVLTFSISKIAGFS